MSELKICKSKRNGKLLIYQHYVYNLSTKGTQYISWRCKRRGCTGRIHTNEEITVVIKLVCHDHCADIEEENQILLNDELKKRCMETAENFYDALTVCRTKCNQNLSFKKVYKNMNDDYVRLQNKKLCNDEKKTYCSDIPLFFHNTLDSRKFLFYDSGLEDQERIIIFTTYEFLERLGKSHCMLGDGTFKSVSVGFSQLFILHGFIFNSSFPLIYVLMASRSESSYCKVFSFIKQNIEVVPSTYICDFEIAQVNAIQQTFSEIDFRGCNFHFSQILWRNIQHENLTVTYKKNVKFREFVKKLISLSYVPIKKVEKYVSSLIRQYTNSGIEYDNILHRFNYLFINNNSIIHMKKFWNCYDRLFCGLPLTTNALEGYHRHFNNCFKNPHPNLAKLLDILQKEEQRIKIKIHERITNKVKVKKNKKYEQIIHVLSLEDSLGEEEFLTLLASLTNIKT